MICSGSMNPKITCWKDILPLTISEPAAGGGTRQNQYERIKRTDAGFRIAGGKLVSVRPLIPSADGFGCFKTEGCRCRAGVGPHDLHFFLPAELGNVGPTAQVPFGGNPFP